MPSTDYPTDTNTHDSHIDCNTGASNHSRCPGCEEDIPDGSSCDDCVTCDHCLETVPDAETIETLRGSTICAQCRRGWYWQCHACDGWNRDGSDCANECCGSDCDDCRNDNGGGDRGGLVEDYDYKPNPVFHGTGPLFLGPEIEIETPYGRNWGCATIAHTHLGNLGYLKNDASIYNGFEIVTHPMSYQWAVDNFPWHMLTQLEQAGCQATDTTGIHVHLSRAGFTSACHTFRWMKFIYRNERQVTTLARRSSSDYAAFTDGDRRAVKAFAKGARGQRCRAINTGNTDTFELRIFASSLDPREVKAALGFAAASVEYTRTLTLHAIVHGAGWTWPAFVAWLAERPAYEPLTEQLEALACVS